jgi:hypothetical protein
MGIPEYEAKRYEGKVKSGNILLSIHTENSDERERQRNPRQGRGRRYLLYRREFSPPKDKAVDRRV